MRCITYAGETVTTTDDVAAVLVELTAALANRGKAESVDIPIMLDDGGGRSDAELVIGVGNDVLSVAEDWDGPQPDFSEAAERLQRMLDDLKPKAVAYTIPDGSDEVDPYGDFDDPSERP
ncbi:hypothetical protein NY547_03745 [Cnuibacter physcomitrellae]|uniref:hypothetical protein n=1 Tax=Cnuibacter physcomitrellae TaxID=1619308 RepID=UPI002175B6A2|nr:hypothetical protein [Cnuibacter physcomitrellae]MCS5496350.1 hypothetical protein [Cnuibacter physcomitrellae]